MTTSTSEQLVDDGTSARVRGLRNNVLAGLVMLILEYGLGIWTNLYANLPASDHGKATFAAFAGAVAHGPVGLTLHALLGTLLIVTAISVVVRAVLIRQSTLIIIGSVALLAIFAAWVSGARFVGHSTNGASFSMALATGVAILGYATILFIAIPTQVGATVRPAVRTGSRRGHS